MTLRYDDEIETDEYLEPDYFEIESDEDYNDISDNELYEDDDYYLDLANELAAIELEYLSENEDYYDGGIDF